MSCTLSDPGPGQRLRRSEVSVRPTEHPGPHSRCRNVRARRARRDLGQDQRVQAARSRRRAHVPLVRPL